MTYLCFVCACRCYNNGRRVIVVPKASAAESSTLGAIASNLWTGYVLECGTCGVIFKSRENWFDNAEPDKCGVVHTSVCHMWPGLRAPQGKKKKVVYFFSEAVFTYFDL